MQNMTRNIPLFLLFVEPVGSGQAVQHDQWKNYQRSGFSQERLMRSHFTASFFPYLCLWPAQRI
jgi:hypothetical protein